MAGITTLTGGAMARWVETGRYLWAVTWAVTESPPEAGGCRAEVIGVSLSSGGPPRPRAARLSVRFERGVGVTHGTTAWNSVHAGVSWQSWPTPEQGGPVARHGSVTRASPSTAPPYRAPRRTVAVLSPPLEPRTDGPVR
ncbi:hypothetical protein GCM10010389_57540 [Streptomyces echinoruber]|uniref:Uncharacterized protein n=1 Tax=Streptomyces echinoruber TaxID=68898 RepID=A0A918RW24_9ACTN|nr:hypothetical protein GCM10010389_57540 [Streptomyces echinoruber]